MKTFTHSSTSAKHIAMLLAMAGLVTTALAMEPDCDQPQGLYVEFQTASASRNKCGGFGPYQVVSPTTRHRVETITESAGNLTLSEDVSPSDKIFTGRLAACGGNATLSTSFSWDVSGGNTNASVSFRIMSGTTTVTNQTVPVTGGSSGNLQVTLPIAGGQYPVIEVYANSPVGSSTIAFVATQSLGTIVATYTIQTNGTGCTGPSTSGSLVTLGYGSGWVTNSSTSKYITNGPTYTPAQKSYELTDEYTTGLLESLGRADVESAAESAWAARGGASSVTARRSLAPDELSISLRKMRTRMTFTSVPDKAYRLTWIEATIADNAGVGGYQHQQKEVYGAPNARTTTVVNDWIAPPDFNGDISILNPKVELARHCTDCEAGSAALDADGVNYSLDLGSGAFDRSVGELSLHQQSPVNMGNPGLLRFIGDTNHVELITSGGSALLQVKAPQVMVKLLVTSNSPGGVPLAYTIDCYSPANFGNKDTNGLYQPVNPPYVTWTVSNRDANPTNCSNLMITEARGSRVYTNLYTYTNNGSATSWTLSAGNGLLVKSVEDDFGTASTNHTQTIEIANSSGPKLKMKTHFKAVPGQEMQKAVLSNGTWFIHFKHDQYGRLTNATHSDGNWMRYTYDSLGRVDSVQSAFMNYTKASGGKRQTSFEYGTNGISGSGDTGQDLWIPRRVTEYVYPSAGTPVGVRQIDHILGNGWRKLIYDFGGIWSYSGNNVTLATYYTNGDFKEKLKSIDYPDTTREVFFYQTNATTKTTTILNGEADPGNATNVLSGTRTIVVVGLFGETLAVTNFYFTPSSSVLTGLEVYEYLDDMGKSHRCHYLNGTTRLVQYSCCGLEHIEEPDGTSQWFYHDDLKRVTAILSMPANILVTNRLDGLGRIINTTQISSNGTQRFLYGASYDDEARIISQTNALNGVISYAYSTNAQGQVITTITNPDQSTRIETAALDGSLNLVDGTSAFPMRFEAEVNGTAPVNYRLTRRSIRLGANGATNEWQREFITALDTIDRVERPAATGSSLNSYTYSFNYARNQLTAATDEEGAITLFAYDALGRLDTTALDRSGTGLNYNGNDRITKVTADALTNSSGVAVLRQRTFVWETDNSAVSNLIASTELSIDGLQAWQTVYTAGTSLTTTNQTAYYSNGLVVITSTSPDNSQQIVTNRYGRRISETAYDGANPRQKIGQVIYGYDEFGRQNSATDDRNGTTTYFFNNAGQISGVQSPPVGGVSLTTSNYFDIMGRIWKTTLPDGTSVTNEFHPTGLLKKTSGSRTYPVEYTYDTQGRVRTMVTWSAAGAETNTWLYNTNRGWLEKRIHPDGTGPSYAYWPSGRLLTRTWVRKSGGTPISATYSHLSAGELYRITYSDSTPLITFGFNRLGQLTNVFANSITTSRKFDRLGNLLGETYSGGTLGGLSFTNQYDSLLRRSSLAVLRGATNLHQVDFGFDTASRLQTVSQLSTTNFQPVTASYRYISSSPLVESIAFTNNGAARLTLNKTYDALERLTSISALNSQPSTIDSFTYSYNTASQRASVTNEANAYWVYQYDALGQVASARRYWPDGTPVAGQQYDYTYDNIGNLTSTATGGDQYGQNLRTASYTANTRNQYTSRTVPGYLESYGTAHSNATVTVNLQPTYRHGEYFRGELAVSNGVALWQGVTNIGVLNNGTNADIVTTNLSFTFLPATPETFLYDPDGNLTNDGRFAYTWDAENRLLTMTSPTNIPAAARRKLTFEYDWAGRRIRKDVSQWTNNNWAAIEAKKFCYDGWNLVAELNATNNALIRSYAWGLDVSGSQGGAGGVGALLWVNDQSTLNSQPSTHLASYDGNGNVSSLVNAADGTLSAKYEYGPFGDLIQASGAMARSNPIRFSSKYQDNDTGLLYYGYRYYSPSLQRWLNRDPLQEPGGLNLYGFVGNSPLNALDTDGQFPFGHIIGGSIVGGIIGGVAAAVGDLRNGRGFSWASVGRGAAEGAIAGGVFAATFGSTMPAGVLGILGRGIPAGLASDLAAQGTGLLGGWRKCFSTDELLLSGAFGAVAPFVGKLLGKALLPLWNRLTGVTAAELAAVRGMGFDSVAAYRQAWLQGASAEVSARLAAVRGMGFSSVQAYGQAWAQGVAAETAAASAAKSATQLELDFGQSLPWLRNESGLVIGRGRALSAPGTLGPGEYRLTWESVQETSGVVGEWAVNRAKLQNVMKLNLPIRDASPLSDLGGLYLNSERWQIMESSWLYRNGSWIPPKP